MPLFKTINVNPTTKLLVWKITESYEDLFNEVNLKEKSRLRLDNMKSELQQRTFLSVRKLLQEVGFNDSELHYDEFGKPHLENGQHISITHSHGFSAIIISDKIVGIDMELQRDKIVTIAPKFVNDAELKRLKNLDPQEYIKKLTVKWGAKEAIFKIRNEKGISFKDHIRVSTFELMEKQTLAHLHFGGLIRDFRIYFEEIENLALVFAFEK
jgi:4'-phosphopantetheinyl transferase